jgi:hypothetical protein
MLSVWNQAKQAAHSRLPISISLSEELGIQLQWPPSKKITKGPHIGHIYLTQVRLGRRVAGEGFGNATAVVTAWPLVWRE